MMNDIDEYLLGGGRLDSDRAVGLLQAKDLRGLMAIARTLRDHGHGDFVSYSRKVFIPLTHLCRDVCHYCAFARPPERGTNAYLSPEETISIARRGAAAGCKEALFTLGDKPELRWKLARTELAAMGFATTLAYLADVANRVRRETGLLPHFNPGVMSTGDLAELRRCGISMGLMLETRTPRLSEKGGPHYGSPDKHPEERLACIESAGKLDIPFTSGLLIGIGETRAERIEALLALRELHERYGHLQEIIIQNFRPKPGTPMANTRAVSIDELCWTIAVARIVFGPDMNIQAPPNLSPGAHKLLIDAGINDWGGISPITIDHVNPEAPWPQVNILAALTDTSNKILVERLAIYPKFALAPDRWVDSDLRPQLMRMHDAAGFAREDDWLSGVTRKPPEMHTFDTRPPSSTLTAILSSAGKGKRLSEEEIVALFETRGSDFGAVCKAADAVRRDRNGSYVSYVVNRNINYTNVCIYACKFCAFSKGRTSDALRGKPYNLDMAELTRRVREAWARGATEVCLQGGIHPQYTGETYIGILKAVKAAAPDIHVHAFSPLEIWQGAATIGSSLRDYLVRLKESGLASLPGTAAEILDDEVRVVLCPDKLTTAQWFEVMEAAHRSAREKSRTITLPLHPELEGKE